MSESAVTLLAVIVGAVLATVGGFAATRLDELVRRRERERAAARLFGEILSVLALLTRIADEARGRGEPFGPLTLRLLRAVRREAEVYDRNRESLYDLRDVRLRARIHTVLVRVTLGLEGVFDSTADLASAEVFAAGLAADDPIATEAVARVAALIDSRHAAFEWILQSVGLTGPIITALQPLARQTFDAHASVVESV